MSLRSFKKLQKNRVWLMPTVTVALFTLLVVRVVDLQVVQAAKLRSVAESNRFFHKVLGSDRGLIVDRFGMPLVFNKPVYYRLSSPSRLYSQRTLVDESDALQLIATASSSVFMQQFREYKYPESLSQITGYVGSVTREDLDRDPDLLLTHQIGKVGLESTYQSILQGEDGEMVYETDAKGEIIRTVSEKDPVAGKHIQTAVDAELSEYAFGLLKGKKAAILVGNPNTGELLTLVSSPTFNVNQFTIPSMSETQELEKRTLLASYFQNPDKLFFNRALAGGYPPGSVFKTVTALGALEDSVIDEETSVDDEGVLKVGEFEYGNWFYRQYGRVEGSIQLVRAIARSNDIYFYKAAEWLGPDRLAQMARLVGFGAKTGIELPAEALGIVPDPEWKEKTVGTKWYLGDTYHVGIGQGDLLVTPAQVFQAMTVFANKGKLCAPTLIKGKSGNCKDISVDSAHLDTINKGLEGVCSAGGTAFSFFPWNAKETQKVFCKTGTAEFGAADAKGHRKTHGWFIGFTHLNTHSSDVRLVENGRVTEQTVSEQYPQDILMVVLVESDEDKPFKEGSADAAPIALEILKWIEGHR